MWKKLIVLAALCLVGVSACSSPPERSGKLLRGDIQRLARVSLPADVKILASEYQRGQDYRLRVKLSMQASDVAEFITASELPKPEPGRRPFHDDKGFSGWTPDAAVTVEGADQHTQPVGDVFRSYLIDRDNPTTITVYLVAFTT